ncbi:MAG: PH domain-containing protein, partial [Rhodothermales bacterium]
MQPLDPAIKSVWTIKLSLGWAIIGFVVLTYDVFQLFDPDRLLPFGVLTGLVILLGVTLTLLLPRLRYRFWRFDLRPEELYLERGIFNRVRTIVPLRRIQHLDVSQDLLERNFHLGKLIVHT